MAESETESEVSVAEDAANAPLWPEADEFVAEHYGLAGEVTPRWSGDSPSYFIGYEEVTCRLDFGASAEELRRFHHEHDILHHLRAVLGRIDAPEVLASQQGPELISLDGSAAEGDQPFARLFAHPPGSPMPEPGKLTPVELGRLGTFAAQLIRDLAAVGEREPQEEPTVPLLAADDLRQAGPQVVQYLRQLTDPSVRDPIARMAVMALKKVQPLGENLRIQLIHHHPVGESLVGLTSESGWVPTGFCDPDSLGEGWVVSALAALWAESIGAGAGTVDDLLPAAAAFHAELPLTDAELTALWPLTLAHVALKRSQMELYQEDIEDARLQQIRAQFELAANIDPALMEAAVREAVGWPEPAAPEFLPLLPDIDLSQLRLVDLSANSPLFAEGNWSDAEADWRILARVAWDTKMGATRFGEYRLSRGDYAPATSENLALHVDICLPAEATIAAPFGGTIQQVGGPLVLSGKDATLYLEGVETVLAEGTMVFAGDRLGSVSGAEGSVGGLRIRLAREAGIDPPLFASAETEGRWRRLVLSPSLILGVSVDAPAQTDPGYVRGWKEHIFDARGNRYLDLTGAPGLLGFGNPQMAEAAYRQWLMLGGTPATSIESEYQAAILQDMPGHLDTVLALTDEAQAIDIARQLGSRLFDKDGGAIIADERLTGFWRNGSTCWGFEQHEELPDIVVTGSPVSQERLAAVILSRSVLPEGLELPQPDASVVACRMGLTVLDALEEPERRDHAALMASLLERRLAEVSQKYPALTGVEGKGLGLELQLSDVTAQALAEALRQRAVLTSAPSTADRLTIIAPLCISEESVKFFIAQLEACLPQAQSHTDDAGTASHPFLEPA